MSGAFPTRKFGDDARWAAQRLRDALAELIASAGGDATSAPDMVRRFGFDKNMSWKLSRVVTEENPLAAIPHMPGRAGIAGAIRLFEKAGAPAQAVHGVRTALEEFDEMVRTHAGDRETLEVMLAGVVPDGPPLRDEANRKLSFLGNSAIWGVQARVQVSAHFMVPSATPARIDFATISGVVDFRRLRPDVPWAVASVRLYTDDGRAFQGDRREPIDPTSVTADGAPLLGDFCSRPLPSLRVAPGPGGVTRFEIPEGPVGNTAAATVISGWLSRAVFSVHRTEQDQLGEHYVNLTTPVELVVHDMFIHRDLTFAHDPQLVLYSQLPGGPTYLTHARERGVLPLREGRISLGACPPDVLAPEIPRYRQMLQLAVDRLGVSMDDLHGFRMKMRYPPIPTLALFRHGLIPPP